MDEELDSHDQLVPKANTKSMIWTYFGCLKVNGKIKDPDNPKCQICWEKKVSKSISCKDGNTSNLFSHLCYHHPKEFAKVHETKAKGTGSQE